MVAEGADAAPDGARPTRTRFAIMVLLFVSVTINYLDRSNLSITAPAMRTAFPKRVTPRDATAFWSCSTHSVPSTPRNKIWLLPA